MSLLEALVATAAIAILVAGAFGAARVLSDRSKGQEAGALVGGLIAAANDNYGSAGRYPAGLATAITLARSERIPPVRFDPATGCFALDGTSTLCVAVTDDGAGIGVTTGYGSSWRLTYTSVVSRRNRDICLAIGRAARTSLLDAQVSGSRPVGVDGQLLHGSAWEAWWAPRCAVPLTAEFTLR